MLEIRTERKRADSLLIGDSWAWGEGFWEVESITNVYVDMEDTGLVRITARRGGRLESWHLDVDQLVTVEVEGITDLTTAKILTAADVVEDCAQLMCAWEDDATEYRKARRAWSDARMLYRSAVREGKEEVEA